MPVNKETAALAGSIMAAALIAGTPGADAKPTKAQASKAQASKHASSVAKDKLAELGHPGITEDVSVGEQTEKPPVEEKKE